MNAPPSFHLLARPTGSVRDLGCASWFFLEKERLYPGLKPRMSEELLERHIRQLIDARQTPEVTIAWSGGCPEDRFVATPPGAEPPGEPGLNHLRAGQKAFFRHVDAPLRRTCALLRTGRAPSAIVEEYRGREGEGDSGR